MLQEFLSHHDWLQLSVYGWHDLSTFYTIRSFVRKVKAVNDAAKRKIKLNANCAKILAGD